MLDVGAFAYSVGIYYLENTVYILKIEENLLGTSVNNAYTQCFKLSSKSNASNICNKQPQ